MNIIIYAIAYCVMAESSVRARTLPFSGEACETSTLTFRMCVYCLVLLSCQGKYNACLRAHAHGITHACMRIITPVPIPMPWNRLQIDDLVLGAKKKKKKKKKIVLPILESEPAGASGAAGEEQGAVPDGEEAAAIGVTTTEDAGKCVRACVRACVRVHMCVCVWCTPVAYHQPVVVIVGASVSEPHTSGFNAAFSLLCGCGGGLWTSYVVSKFAINISMFHLGLHTWRARTRTPQHTWPAGPTNWLANGTVDVGRDTAANTLYQS